MIYGVAANRMTLMRTRKRMATARRGHALMKHKLEELMRIFQREIENARGLEETVRGRLQEVYVRYVPGSAQMETAALSSLLAAPVFRVSLAVGTEPVLNLRLPLLECSTDLEAPPYGLFDTNDDLDAAVHRLRKSFPLLIRLAQTHRRLSLLAAEIETTRRRVNALEYVLIPRLEDQAGAIQMKLDEMERSNVSRLMRIKSVIRKSASAIM